jgi:hypothetical protein
MLRAGANRVNGDGLCNYSHVVHRALSIAHASTIGWVRG